MQIRSFRGSGEPAWVNAYSNACLRLGPDPRRALGPAAAPAASTGRTRDRTRPMLQKRQKVLARAPSTRDPKRRSLRCKRVSAVGCKAADINSRAQSSRLAEFGALGMSFNICRGTLGSFAIFTAIRNASSRDSRFIDICRCGSSSK